MLNLTASAVTLLAQSGETITIEPSGYVSSVATTRTECDYFPVREDDLEGSILRLHVPIIEENPAKIVCEMSVHPKYAHRDPAERAVNLQGIVATYDSQHGGEAILLVTQEVAEAAARPVHDSDGSCEPFHPLASRMVWAIDGTQLPAPSPYAYRALQRVPQ